MQLSELGDRICILGPSNSGKSTLADAIARKCGLEVVHLDQLHHRPGTDWEPRPHGEFLALHDAAIAAPRWVVDGNYSSCMPQRFARATGVVLLDVSVPASLFRYFRRSWFGRDRKGGLSGARDSVNWLMIHHIAAVSPRNRARYARMFDEIALPKLRLGSIGAIRRIYREWGLER